MNVKVLVVQLSGNRKEKFFGVALVYEVLVFLYAKCVDACRRISNGGFSQMIKILITFKVKVVHPSIPFFRKHSTFPGGTCV